MRMMKCPKCEAPNSVRGDACLNCGFLLAPPAGSALQDASRREPARRSDLVPAGDRIPTAPLVIGLLLGLLAVPFGLWFLASDLRRRRVYGKGLLLGAAVAVTAIIPGLILLGLVLPDPDVGSGRGAAAVYRQATVGMPASEVLQICGEPDRRQAFDVGRSHGGFGVPPVRREHWHYGNTQLVFEKGILVSKTSH